MKRILKWLIVLCMILPLIRLPEVHAASFSFTLTDGRTITSDDYKDDVVMVVWYSAETDENGNAVNANSASILKTLSKDPLINTEGLTVIAAAVEDMDPKAVDAFIDKYGRNEKILYAYNGQESLNRYDYENDPFRMAVCAFFEEGLIQSSFDNNSDNELYSAEIIRRMHLEKVYTFDLQNKIVYHQNLAREMIDLVNAFRTGEDAWYWNPDNTEKIYAKGLKELVYDYALEKAAMQRVAEIALYFEHIRPDGELCDFTYQKEGIPEDFLLSENIACGTSKKASTTVSFLQEKRNGYSGQGHRRNMLSDRHAAFGFACCEYEGQYYWVQLFSDKILSTDPVPAAENEQTRTVRATTAYVKGWTMEKESIEIEPDQIGSVPEYNRLVAVIDSKKKPVENKLLWKSSDETVISVMNDSFIGLKEGTAVLTATAPDKKTTVQFTATVRPKAEPTPTPTPTLTAKPTPTPTPAPATKTIEMHRLYNPNSWEHFYTGNVKEKDALVKMGWQYEGVGWTAPEKSNTPVYRLYNPNNGGDHHYTKNKKEYDALVKAGWIGEDVRWYSDDKESVPVYREYNPGTLIRNHNYTANKKEHDALISFGWKDEGIGWYGVK